MNKIFYCPACKADASKKIEAVIEYDIYKCLKCGLHYSSPMRAGDEGFYLNHIVYRTPAEIDAKLQYNSFDNSFNKNILNKFSVGSRALDIGCGYGAFTALAINHGIDAYGVDFNHEFIEIGRSVFKLSDQLQVGLVKDICEKFSLTSFDLITMFEVIEHVENPRELIEEAFKLLAPGGSLVLSCPNEDRWQPFGRIFVDYPPHHLTRWNPKSLSNLLSNIGFENISIIIDSNLRDLFWTYMVNKSALYKTSQFDVIKNNNNKYLSKDIKRLIKIYLYKIAKYIFIIPDFVLNKMGIGTMGMRTIAIKPNIAK